MVSILSLHKPHTQSKYEMESTESVKPVKKIIRKKKIVVKKKKEEPEPEPEPEKKEQETQEKSVDSYQMQMTDLERKTMLIAQDHLGTSFSMEKSTGYLKYLET